MENPGGKPNQREKETATANLLRAYLERGDTTARDRLVELYLPLVESFAHRYEGSEDYDDLFQAGCIGLIKAIDRFDLERGGELAAFAVPNIAGEIKRHLRDRTTPVRTPRPIQELRARALRCEAELSAAMQRRPTAAEVARELGADREDVARALAARRPSAQEADTPPAEATLDALGLSDERMTLASAFEALDERERQIVYLRFMRDRSRSEVARELGISERHLSRQTHAALAKLRDRLERARRETAPARAAAPRGTSRQPPRDTPTRRFTRPEHRSLPYHISIVRERGNAEEGRVWTARAEELPGCQAHGATVEEAVRGIEDAIDGWIDDALANGREVPSPRAPSHHSGRLMLRMPRSLHAELAEAAERERVSLNHFIATSLERALASDGSAASDAPDGEPGVTRTVPRLLRVAILVNLIAVLAAAVVAVILLVAGSQQGW
jgi:RNA polymerase sigma factor (sigma-70 family)